MVGLGLDYRLRDEERLVARETVGEGTVGRYPGAKLHTFHIRNDRV